MRWTCFLGKARTLFVLDLRGLRALHVNSRPLNQIWVYPHWKAALGNFGNMLPSVPIFPVNHFLRQNFTMMGSTEKKIILSFSGNDLICPSQKYPFLRFFVHISNIFDKYLMPLHFQIFQILNFTDRPIVQSRVRTFCRIPNRSLPSITPTHRNPINQ